jgi:hypothetical protein
LNEDSNNRKLLIKYLKAFYGLEKATELLHKYKDTMFTYHNLAWSLGKKSFEFFCLYFLQDTFLPKEDNSAAPIASIHREIWHDIQESIIGDGADQIGRILPRGTGKSAFGTFASTIWCHSYEFKKYTLICSDIGSTAEKFTKDIKNTFLENKYLEKAFGTLLNDRDKRYICNSTQLELTNKSFIEAISSASPMRGRKYNNIRPDLIILDDYQSTDDVRTEEAREKKWFRYSTDVKYASQKALYRDGKVIKRGTTFLGLGTLQHKECFYSRLIKQPTWKFKNDKGVLIEDIDTYFNNGLWLEFKNILFNFKTETHLEDAKEFYWSHQDEMQFPMLWAEFWDCLDMAMSYFENPSSFKQEVQGDVESIGERFFKTIRTQSVSEIEEHKFVKTMLCADPASSISMKADYSAICIGSIASNDLTYIRKGILVRLNFDDFCSKIVTMLKQYTDVTHVSLEKNLYMGADASKINELILKEPELRHRHIEFINKMQKVNKDEKISTIIAGVNTGQIIFNENDVDAINQMLEFSGQKYSNHDDMPDCVSQLIIDIKEIEVKKVFRMDWV